MIDFHTHIFPEAIAPRTIAVLQEKCQGPAYTNGMVSGLAASMEASQIAVSVVLPVVTKPSQFASVNQFAAELNQTYGSNVCSTKLISFGGIHPDCENYKKCLKDIKELGLKGIKLHPDYQGTFINDVKYMRIIEYASELDLVVVTHSGYDVGYPDEVHCPPKLVREVIDKVQPKKLVLAHMGGMTRNDGSISWDEVEEYLVGKEVWLDTAYVLPLIPPETFRRIVRSHGASKILFASDSPWREQKQCVDLMANMKLSGEEWQMIMEENAKRLLGFPLTEDEIRTGSKN